MPHHLLKGAAFSCALLFASATQAQLPAVRTPADQVPHGQEIPLWEGAAPGALGTTPADIPHMEFFGASPDAKLADGLHTAVIVCPGGGYTSLAYDKEGTRIAEWLNGEGISAFVLTYRLAPRYRYPAPILDGERAVRWLRAHAAEYGISPHRIGAWGFSAGGHLVGMLGTQFDGGKPDATDPVDRVSDRPDFVISSYGGLTLDPAFAKNGAMETLTGPNPPASLREQISPDRHVTHDSPPFFLYATQSDQRVPVLSTVVFFQALTRAGVPAEMHIFQTGPHGTALGGFYPELSVWPSLLDHWLRLNGWLFPYK